MESSTLDFDDLMDTGDEYPGFEIAKFAPATTNKDDDSILKTPEPENEEDAEKGFSKQSSENERTPASYDTPLNMSMQSMPSAGKRELDDDRRDGEITGEPEIKKKKHMYLQPPKPKMKLWAGKKDYENKTDDKKDKDESGGETDRSQARSKSPSKFNGDSDSNSMVFQDGDSQQSEKTEESKSGEKTEEKVDEEDPHQQSFLSFFNLKPGSGDSKPDDKKKDVTSKELDFLSRKRLRTRKKVSYVEDVVDDNDEEYKGEEEEDMEDHMLNIRRRRSSSGGTSRRKPSFPTAAASYAQALQNLSPQTPGRPPSQIQPSPQALQVAMALQKQRMGLSMPRIPMPAAGALLGTPHHGQIKGLFECGLCGTFFNTASQFIAHQEQAHATENKNGRSGMETFRCEICQFVLTNRFAYLEHKRMKHMKNQVTFSCHKCGRTFGYLMDLQKHKDQCGQNLPMCGVCNLKFSTLQELVHHRNKIHSAGATRQWLTCLNKPCTFKSLTQHEMNQHVKKQHMTGEYVSCSAPGCARIFSTRELLHEHRKEVHASEFIVQYQCMECKMCYSSKTLLAEHQYLHTMDKLRKCDICMRQFGTISQLKRHKEVHSTKGTVQCSSCARWCKDKEDLLGHVCKEKHRKFSSVQLYFCDICMKDFKADEPMFKHRREHKGYYQCSTCLTECKSETDFFEHREVHGLFTCPECCEELPSKAELETHVKAHKYYVKMIQSEFNGKNAPVMYLCPNLMNMIKA